MTAPDDTSFPRARLAAGRFAVRLPGRTESGLTAEEAVFVLNSAGAEHAEAFRIHRVLGDSGLELVGVSAESLSRPAATMFPFETVADARRFFDELLAASRSSSPPSRVEVRLVALDGKDHRFGVVLQYCEACEQPVHDWVRVCAVPDDRQRLVGPGAFDRIQSGISQEILREVVAPDVAD
jgi:hypothetical protein